MEDVPVLGVKRKRVPTGDTDTDPRLSKVHRVTFCQDDGTRRTKLISPDNVNKRVTWYGGTHLVYACVNTDEVAVDQLLAIDGIDVNLPCDDGQSALMTACVKDNANIVNSLLAVDGIDVNQRDSNGHTPLLAAMGGWWWTRPATRVIISKLLTIDEIDVNAQSKRGYTALMTLIAARDHHYVAPILDQLLAFDKLDVNVQDTDGRTALYMVCSNGNEAAVRRLLALNRIDVNRPTKSGWTPLMIASCWQENYKILDRLLADDRTDVNHHAKYGPTALETACVYGNADVVRRLLDDRRTELRGVPAREAFNAVPDRYQPKIWPLFDKRQCQDIEPALTSLLLSSSWPRDLVVFFIEQFVCY